MTSTQQILTGDCLTAMVGLPDGCVDLTLTSPPYEDARLYNQDFKLTGERWVSWMIPRVLEMCRVTAGLVFINMAGKVRQFSYSPVVEWLVADLTRQDGIVCGPAPYVFHRVGIPGSGSKHYHRRDWEPVYGFALAENLPPKWSDNTATGRPTKYLTGGELSHRTAEGRRINADKCTPTKLERQKNNRQARPAKANSGNVITGKVGGGHMGDSIAHSNEAPMPEWLAEFFILSYCPPDGVCLDPFCGSGTTLAVAAQHNRGYVGIDNRQSQVDLTKKRLANVTPNMF